MKKRLLLFVTSAILVSTTIAAEKQLSNQDTIINIPLTTEAAQLPSSPQTPHPDQANNLALDNNGNMNLVATEEEA